MGIPHRLACALQVDGWIWRQDIVWHKPAPMPESVKDRCTKAHEYIFMLTKARKYYYDWEAIADPCVESNAARPRMGQGKNTQYSQKRDGAVVKPGDTGEARWAGQSNGVHSGKSHRCRRC